jgi:cytochrome c oxidase accessory protein FixG
MCVQVCPTGIDIRNGLQYECIGCAACIDGCNQVMEKMGYPRGLIRYATENALKRGYNPARMLRRVLRPRVLIYTALLAVIMGVFLAGLALRTPLKVDVIRDRGALVRETRDGRIENVYRLQIMNTDERAHRYVVTASGLPGLRVTPATPVTVAAAATQSVALTVQADPADLKPGSHTIVFHVESVDQPALRADEKSRFFARSR